MTATPLELRKWYQALIGAITLSVVAACMFVLRAALSAEPAVPHIAAAVLGIGAMGGIYNLLRITVAIALTKLFPSIESA
jgi:hypothetical protein